MLYYKLRCKEAMKRYCHKAAVYYTLCLRSQVEGQPLYVKPPTRGYTSDEVSYFLSRGIDPKNFFP